MRKEAMSSMLHRSFKPAKCKTALKLAVSRIKLLKNKRETQVRQLKRDLAQLLESGQDQTARIRVEHVIREEKTMAAYDLVEIYCELIAARMPMIESQKNCPIDLKEAITSVIFATPRCSDIPELMDVRKHITAKYGKEFVSAAVELRPDCGVNRLLVEKLSAKAPDGPTKMKILAAIAEEHNIKWEPKSFGENDVKSSQDLLVGPNTFEKATYEEPSQVHVPPAVDEKVPPNLPASSQLKPMHDISTPMHDISTETYEQNASGATRKDRGNQPTTSGMSNPKIISSGTGSQEMDFGDSHSENRSAFPVGRQNWNMEFKDAASAAQAAAESAELASMAARAAAELSNRENMTRPQHSRGSHSSSGSRLRDEVPQGYAFPDDKHLSTGSVVNSTIHRTSSGMHNEQINAREQDNFVGVPDEYYSSQENMVKHAQSASLTSVRSFGSDNPFANASQMGDIYQHKSFEKGSNDFHQVSVKRQASRTEADFVTEQHGDGDLDTEDNYHFRDARTNRQPRQASSSHLISPSYDHDDNLNSSGWKMGNKAAEDQFVTDEGNTLRNTMETSSYNDTSGVFDDSGSEDDGYKFDVDKNYKGEFFSSPGSKSQLDSLDFTNSWSHEQDSKKESSSSSQRHFSMVSEGLTKSEVSYDKQDTLPVTFDDSDDSGSDNEVDLVKSKDSENFDYVNSVFDQSVDHGALGSSARTDKNVGSSRKSWLSPSSVGSDTLEEHFDRKVDISTVSEKNFGYNDLPTSPPSSKGSSSTLGLDLKPNILASRSPDTFNDTETSQESRIESGKELNYGTLTGGLRNKGYRRPPYIKSTLDEGSSSLEDISVQNERSLPTVRTSVSSNAPAQDKYTREVSRGNRSMGLRARNTFSDSDSYDLSTNSQESLSSSHEPRIQTQQSETKKKPSSRTSITFFDSDNSDYEEEHPNQNSTSVTRPVSGVSRRTLAASKTGRGLSSKDAPLSEGSMTPGAKLGWKSSSTSYESTNQEPSSMKSSENWASSAPGSAEPTASKPISEPNRWPHKEITKSSTSVQPSSSLRMTVLRDSEQGQEASKSLNSDADTPSKEMAGHVHPKLPDYDSFAAHFLSLRKGSQ